MQFKEHFRKTIFCVKKNNTDEFQRTHTICWNKLWK